MMMTQRWLHAAICLVLFAGAARADVLTDMASITETGQGFIFSFNGVGLSDGTDGTLLIEALGDYSPAPPSSERINFDVDGVFSDFAFDPSRGGSVGTDLFQNEAMQSYTVPGADMVTITGDGMVTMTLQNTSSVNFFTDQPEDFVRATLTYAAVPEPAGLMALLIGFAFTLLLRRLD